MKKFKPNSLKNQNFANKTKLIPENPTIPPIDQPACVTEDKSANVQIYTNEIEEANHGEFFNNIEEENEWIVKNIFPEHSTTTANGEEINCQHSLNQNTNIELANTELCNISALDNISHKSFLSTQSASTSSSRKSQIALFRKNALKPLSIEEDVDRFSIPLKEFVLKIPSGSPLVKKEANDRIIKYENMLKDRIKDESKDNNPGTNLGPQICIDADGNMILNETSLFIQPKSEYNLKNVVEFEDENTYKSYRNQGTKNHKWLPVETKKFYICLQMVGLDFGLISKLLQTKDRKQCLSKYKKESKINPEMINYSLKKKIPYDTSVINSLEITLNKMPKKSGRSKVKSYDS